VKLIFLHGAPGVHEGVYQSPAPLASNIIIDTTGGDAATVAQQICQLIES
jgi:hypothetical protein